MNNCILRDWAATYFCVKGTFFQSDETVSEVTFSPKYCRVLPDFDEKKYFKNVSFVDFSVDIFDFRMKL